MDSFIRVPPKTDYTAEVVILLTSLGAKRSEYNAGKRARDLLEIKCVHTKVIDFNRDARNANTDDAENQAIQKLMAENKLQTGGKGDLVLPQIFIDGNAVGDADDLQALEDDDLLEKVLCRKTCVACYARSEPGIRQCASCWTKFEELLPGVKTIDEVLADMECDKYDEYDEDEEEYDDEEEEEDAGAGV